MNTVEIISATIIVIFAILCVTAIKLESLKYKSEETLEVFKNINKKIKNINEEVEIELLNESEEK